MSSPRYGERWEHESPLSSELQTVFGRTGPYVDESYTAADGSSGPGRESLREFHEPLQDGDFPCTI